MTLHFQGFWRRRDEKYKWVKTLTAESPLLMDADD
jgi:hypothetical protein